MTARVPPEARPLRMRDGDPPGHKGAEATAASASAAGDAAPPRGDKPWSARRTVIESIRPLVDGGRFPAKAAVGDLVRVEADAFADGHDVLACDLRFQREGDDSWSTVEMVALGNDRWQGAFRVDAVGRYRFAVRSGVDRYATWLRDLLAWSEAGQDVAAELLVGADLLAGAASRAHGSDRAVLAAAADALSRARDGLGSLAALSSPEELGGAGSPGPDPRGGEEVLHGRDDGRAGTVEEMLRSEWLAELVRTYRPTSDTTTSAPCTVVVEPALARFSTWYEMFPRGASPDPSRPGTLADVRARLDYVGRLGADVLYLPPVHPIGTTGRKGRDGSTTAQPGDPGSPWAIGSRAGGHTAVDPSLGTLDDFDALVADAARRGIAVALDLAFQCSPDHPWVAEHPEWFRRRPDGTIRYAENPPKRYEDIYNFDFESDAWWELWNALLEVVRFWIGHGVRVFRVDNPHTKPFAFWEWMIGAVKADHPETIFLAEAFTRPKVMYRLAKLGFSQSYTYFAWRNTKWEIETYMAELAQVADFLRPNFWPSTPDILTEVLQVGGTAAFVSRLVLAATLAASYGIYGPPFELQEHMPRAPGSEEYLGSEKYAVRHWDLDEPSSLAGLIGRLNAIRRAHPALQRDDTLRLHGTDNDQLVAYSKSSGDDAVLVVVNVDPHFRQAGWVDLGPFASGPGEAMEVHDLLTGAYYRWEGSHSFVILDPVAVPAHVLTVTTGDTRRSEP